MFKPLLFAYSDVRDRRDVWSPARARVPGVIVSDQDQDPPEMTLLIQFIAPGRRALGHREAGGRGSR